MLNGQFVETANEKLSSALTFCMAVGGIVLGSILVEVLLLIIIYCLCHQCCTEKVAELDAAHEPAKVEEPAIELQPLAPQVEEPMLEFQYDEHEN
jgi:hypothetical protein